MEDQIERFRKGGIPVDAASRYVRAYCYGGVSSREALDIIRAKDCWDGAGHVLNIDLPDRWFRNAWKLKDGKVYIDMDLARDVHCEKLWVFREEYLKKNRIFKLRRSNYETMMLEYMNNIDMQPFAERINRAGSPEELRSIWYDL